MESRVTPDCGHTVTVQGLGAGYGVNRDGRTSCYECCKRWERTAFASADRYVAYVSSDGRTITTWPGGELARVVSTGAPLHRCTPTGGQYVTVHVDVVGSGRLAVARTGPGAGMYVRLRRAVRANRPA